MKRIALFAVVAVLAACSAAEKTPAADSTKAAVVMPAMAPAMDSTKKDSAMMTPPAAPAADTTKKM